MLPDHPAEKLGEPAPEGSEAPVAALSTEQAPDIEGGDALPGPKEAAMTIEIVVNSVAHAQAQGSDVEQSGGSAVV